MENREAFSPWNHWIQYRFCKKCHLSYSGECHVFLHAQGSEMYHFPCYLLSGSSVLYLRGERETLPHGPCGCWNLQKMDDKQMSASLDTDIFDDISSLQNKNNILLIYSDWGKMFQSLAQTSVSKNGWAVRWPQQQHNAGLTDWGPVSTESSFKPEPQSAWLDYCQGQL